MASLAETLRARQDGSTLVRGANGALTEEKPQTIQQLSGQAGLPAPPTTPIGAGMLGANPDQQKMMGTPAQKTAALSLASQPQQQDLQSTLRTQQVRTQQSAPEQQQAQKSTDMQNLGQLGDRVTDFINMQRQILEQKAGTGVDVQASSTFNDKDIAASKDLLGQLRADPTNQQLMLQVNQALGYDINTQLDPSQVDKLYETAVDSISRGAAGDVNDSLTVTDLVNGQHLGYTLPQLEMLLGVPQAQLSTMTVGQLRDEINRVGTQEFSTTNQVDQKAHSLDLGQAERGLARQAGQEASATGVRATEADVNHLEQQIANADQVTFGGKQYKVDDLLKDDTISGIIAEYMNSAPDSDVRKQIDSTETGLSDFIKKNQAVLDDASKQLQTGAGTFKETQDYNKSFQSTPFGGVKLDDSIAALVIPGFGTLQASKIDAGKIPLLHYVIDQGKDAGRAIASELNAANQSIDPTVGKQIAGLDYDSIKNLNIPGSGPTNWNKWKTVTQDRKEASNISGDDYDAWVKKYFTGVSSAADLQQKLKDGNLANTLFANGAPINMGDLDRDGDGQIDWDRLKSNYLNNFQPARSLQDAAGGQAQPYKPSPVSTPKLPQPGSVDDKLYKFANSITSNGVLTDPQIAANIGQLSYDEVVRFNELMKGKSGGQAVQAELDKRNGAIQGTKIDPITFDIPKFNGYMGGGGGFGGGN